MGQGSSIHTTTTTIDDVFGYRTVKKCVNGKCTTTYGGPAKRVWNTPDELKVYLKELTFSSERLDAITEYMKNKCIDSDRAKEFADTLSFSCHKDEYYEELVRWYSTKK